MVQKGDAFNCHELIAIWFATVNQTTVGSTRTTHLGGSFLFISKIDLCVICETKYVAIIYVAINMLVTRGLFY